ncbi:MAG: hypothetical protein AAGA11_02450 [Pseudomonadota bacterium]
MNRASAKPDPGTVHRPILCACLLFLGALATLPVRAEQPGLTHGRLATSAAISPRSVELGARYARDFSYLGARYNARVSDRTTAFIDLGSTRFDGASPAKTVGAGAYYYWGPINHWLDFAARAAVHHIAGRSDTTFLGFDALFSSVHLQALPARWQWYASVGLYRPLNRSDSPKLGLSLGLVKPTSRGQVFVGYDADDAAVAAGYRLRWD